MECVSTRVMQVEDIEPTPAEIDGVVSAVLRGDTERFAEIVRLFQRDVLGIAYAMLGPRDEVEEMAQRCFVSAYEHLDSYQLGTRFDRWLRAIARNVVRMEIRKRATRHRHLATYREHALARFEVCDDNDGYEDDLRTALRECRARLPEPSRQMLAMRYEAEMSFVDIAGAVGRTAQAVQRAISRVRLLLRDCVVARMETV